MKSELYFLIIGSFCPLSSAINLTESASYFYKAISSDRENHENLLFSPFSIIAQMSMTRQDPAPNALFNFYERFLPSVESLNLGGVEELNENDNNSLIIKTIRQVFASNGLEEKEKTFSEFSKNVKNSKTCKGCFLKTVDFSDPEAAAEEINSSVKDETEGYFTEKTVNVSALSANTQMVLVNSLLFNAPWNIPFDAETEKGFFRAYSPTGVQMQSAEYLKRVFTDKEYTIIRHPELDIVCIKYADPRLQFCFFKPDDMDFFEARIAMKPKYLEEQLSLISQAGPMERRRLGVKIPKFKLSAENHVVDLAPFLKKLGVRNMLHEAFAEPREINQGRRTGLFISNFFHQTHFAATAAGTDGVAYKEAPPPSGPLVLRTIHVKLNRPFLFTVVFMEKGKQPNFLLLGRVMNLEGNPVADVDPTDSDDDWNL